MTLAVRRGTGQREALRRLVGEVRACRHCLEQSEGAPLPHEPRPVLQVDIRARLLISGQAPGTRVHASGRPFTDPSGVRLRDWLGIGEDVFYDPRRVAIVPMGLCFPGLDVKGADLPPRRECAPLWREKILAALPNIEMILLVGQYAHRWHLPKARVGTMTATVANWECLWARGEPPRLVPLPHPSWRNNAWLKANPWFAEKLLPRLRQEVARLVTGP